MAAPPPGLPNPPTSGGPGPESEDPRVRPQHAVGRRRRPVVVRLLIAVVVLAAVGYGSLSLVDHFATGADGPVAAPPADPGGPGVDPVGSLDPGRVAAGLRTAADARPAAEPPRRAPLGECVGEHVRLGECVRLGQCVGECPPRLDPGLTTNTLYKVRLDAGTGVCDARIRRPEPPVPDKQLIGYLDSLVDCIDHALTPPLRTAGFDLTKPAVKGYRQQISTPCGWLSPTSAPAYYCSGDNVIYVPFSGDDGDEAYTYARIGYLALVAHEFGHHLQYTSGMFGEYTSRYYKAKLKDRYALSRRLELQADCFAGVFLGYVAQSIDLTAEDRAQLREWHTYTGDEDSPGNRPADHGTSAAQIRWLERGLNSSDYGRCNTWSAAPDEVK